MMFYESGGRAYAVFQVGKELIPQVGFHLPGKMGGVWFGDTRILSSVKVEGLGRALDVVYEDAGRILKFEKGEIEILIPRLEESLYLRFKGECTVSFEIDGTRTWLSKPERFKAIRKGNGFIMGNRHLAVDFDGYIELSDKGFDVHPSGLNTLCISFENAKAAQFDLKRYAKEKDLRSRIPQRRSNTEGALRTFLYEMYFETHNGAGFMAGLEEYPWWFSIDTSFLVPTLLKIGMEDLVKRSLSFIISKSDDIPPHEIISNGVVNDVYNEIELFSVLHSVLVYTRETGDTSLLGESNRILRKAVEDLSSGFPRGKGMVEVSGGNTWLDVSSYAYAFLKEYETLRNRGVLKNEDLDRSLEFFNGNFIEYWYDEESRLFRDDGVHFTQILPLYLGLVPRDIGRSVLMRLSEIGMITRNGLRHSLKDLKEEGYYGEKSEKIWWLANHLLRESVRRYGVLDVSHLENLFEEDLKEFRTPPEIVHGEGCFAQSWSALFGLN